MTYAKLFEIELFDHLIVNKCLMLVIHSNTWNYLTLLAYVYKSYISNAYK